MRQWTVLAIGRQLGLGHGAVGKREDIQPEPMLARTSVVTLVEHEILPGVERQSPPGGVLEHLVSQPAGEAHDDHRQLHASGIDCHPKLRSPAAARVIAGGRPTAGTVPTAALRR